MKWKRKFLSNNENYFPLPFFIEQEFSIWCQYLEYIMSYLYTYMSYILGLILEPFLLVQYKVLVEIRLAYPFYKHSKPSIGS